MEAKKHAGLEFLAVMTFLGVVTAVLVLIIDRQIKADILRAADAVRADVGRLQTLLSEREGTPDARSTAPADLSTD